MKQIMLTVILFFASLSIGIAQSSIWSSDEDGLFPSVFRQSTDETSGDDSAPPDHPGGGNIPGTPIGDGLDVLLVLGVTMLLATTVKRRRNKAGIFSE